LVRLVVAHLVDCTPRRKRSDQGSYGHLRYSAANGPKLERLRASPASAENGERPVAVIEKHLEVQVSAVEPADAKVCVDFRVIVT
jgi:hypothetical protein